MTLSTFLLLPTPALVARLVAEQQCMTDWLQAMADLPGNPFGVAIQRFGQATALVCRTIPAQVYNRIFGLTVADREHIPAIIKFYAQQGASPVFALNPYSIPPYWVEPNVFPALAGCGFYQGAFHQLLYRTPASERIPLPPQLTIRCAGPQDADTFAAVYAQVWSGSAAGVCRSRIRAFAAIWRSGWQTSGVSSCI